MHLGIAQIEPHTLTATMIDHSVSLRTTLSAKRDGTFIFVEPGGNFGDRLIYEGLYKTARELSLDYTVTTFETFDPKTICPTTTLYLHGGGGFVPWWSGRAIKVVQAALDSHAGPVIVGPTTVYNDERYVQDALVKHLAHRSSDDTHIYARDSQSLEVLTRVAAGRAVVNLDHDTATSLTESDILQMAKIGQRDHGGRYVLYALRDDAESKEQRRPSIFYCSIDPVRFCSTFEHWVRVHYYAREIITDRLHSAIGASALGVPVTLLPNSYHKNRCVWEMSLCARGVRWAENLNEIGRRSYAGPSRKKRIAINRFRRVACMVRGVPRS